MSEAAVGRDVRILVLVLGCRAAPYPELIRTIERTWAARDVQNISVLFYYGGKPRRHGRHVILPAPDDLAHVGEKTLAAFDYALQSCAFDVVFRTNCSSYVDLPNLSSYVAEHAEPSGFYAGHLGGHDGVAFASGSGYFLSRDLVDLVVRHRAEWDHSLVDDVALGQVLGRHGIRVQTAPRRDYGNVPELAAVDTKQFHFRCWTGLPSRLEDIEVMLAVHRAFCADRGWDPPPRWNRWLLTRRLSRAASRLAGAPPPRR
jgi:hypothetical protein